MALHKIVVQVNGKGGSQSSSSPVIGNETEESSGGVSATSLVSSYRSFASSASTPTSLAGMVSKMAPIGLGLLAVKVVGEAAISVADGVIGRLGTYTGNTLIDNDVNNIKTGLSMAKSALRNPIQFVIDTTFKMSDFKLMRYQENLEAGYNSYQYNYDRKGVKL